MREAELRQEYEESAQNSASTLIELKEKYQKLAVKYESIVSDKQQLLSNVEQAKIDIYNLQQDMAVTKNQLHATERELLQKYKIIKQLNESLG